MLLLIKKQCDMRQTVCVSEELRGGLYEQVCKFACAMMMVSSGAPIDLSQRNVCAGSRRVIKSSFVVKSAGYRKSFAQIIAEVMADYPKATAVEISQDARYGGICPSGGDYIISVDAKEGNMSCVCTFEGHETDAAEEAALEGFPLLADF